jgi:hypothetical protein
MDLFFRSINRHINYNYDLIAQNDVETIVMVWIKKINKIIRN